MGGGGDGGYSARQAEDEAKKQQARDALNQVFGVTNAGVAPTRQQFTAGAPGTQVPIGDSGNFYDQGDGSVFDEAGYNAALDAYNQRGVAAEKNKAERDALYGDVRTNAFSAGKRSLDENKDKAARDLKFALFAQGLQGGSVDVDQNALLGRTYDKGVLDLGAKADLTKASLRGNDEQTRLGLLQSIDQGLDQGSALSSALNQMRVSADKASAEAQGTDVGDLFANAGLLYSKSQAARGRQAADAWWNQANPQRGNTGIITRTG